jgi:hypothetical protein
LSRKASDRAQRAFPQAAQDTGHRHSQIDFASDG